MMAATAPMHHLPPEGGATARRTSRDAMLMESGAGGLRLLSTPGGKRRPSFSVTNVGSSSSTGGGTGAGLLSSPMASTVPKPKEGSGATSSSSSGAATAPAASAGPLTRLEFLAFYSRIAGLLLISICILLVGATAWPVLAPFHRRRWRMFVDQLQALWTNSLLWLVPPTTMEMHGEFPGATMTPKVIICNHATDVDWIYQLMPSTVTRYGTTDMSGSVKIFLKHEVKSIPIVGWGCALFEFVFLKRVWEVDQYRIRDSLTRFCNDGAPLTIVLYPEGSTVNTRTLEKCRGFARQQGRPELDLTLLPRVRGFRHICDTLAAASPTGDVEVFDQTMTFDSYSGEVPSWEMGFRRSVDTGVPNFMSMFQGRASKRAHIDSRKFSYRQLKANYGADLEAWLDERWVRKEKLLREFIDHQQFDSLGAESRVSVPINGSIRRSLMAVTFYVFMWIGMFFTYAKYAAGADTFF